MPAADRLREIDARLDGLGLPLAHDVEPHRGLDPEHGPRLRRFRAVLPELGPLFVAFGRYLSTRLDHLSGEDSHDLAELRDVAPPLSPDAVREILQRELAPEDVRHVVRLEPVPLESALMWQTHRASLDDGRTVVVKALRPDSGWEGDRALLAVLAPRLAGLGWPLAAVRAMVADFGALLPRRFDLEREAAGLRRVALASTDSRVETATVLAVLTSPRVLTLEMPPSAAPLPAADQATPAVRSLADLWIQLALIEREILEDLSGHSVQLSSRGNVVITGALFHPFSENEAGALGAYLAAAARDDVDGIVDAMLGLTVPDRNARPDALAHRLGHVVPRRDGRFGKAPPGLPELLLSHWPHLEPHGLVPRPGLRAFYRGLVSLREIAGPALSHDVLRESLQVAQVRRGARIVGAALEQGAVSRGALSLLQAFMKVSRALEDRRASRRRGGDTRFDPAGDAATHAGADWMGVTIGLLMGATLAIWIDRLPVLLGSGGRWVLAAAGVLVGGAVLRALWRRLTAVTRRSR